MHWWARCLTAESSFSRIFFAFCQHWRLKFYTEFSMATPLWFIRLLSKALFCHLLITISFLLQMLVEKLEKRFLLFLKMQVQLLWVPSMLKLKTWKLLHIVIMLISSTKVLQCVYFFVALFHQVSYHMDNVDQFHFSSYCMHHGFPCLIYL